MKDLRVCLAQVAPRLGDVAANLDVHVERIDEARGESADLIVFPELSLTGYHLKDLVPEVALAVDDPRLAELRRQSESIDVVFGLVEESPGYRYYNSAVYLRKGRVAHVHRKVFLPTYGLFQEGRDFAAGDRIRTFDTGSGPVGMLICEDLWHPMSSWILTQQGAEMILVLGNGPSRGARPEQGITSVGVWHKLLAVSAQFFTTYFVFVNRVGCEDGLTFGGGSMAIDPFGRTSGEAEALDERLLTVDLSTEMLRRSRTSYPLIRDSNPELLYRELSRLRSRRYDIPDEPERSGTNGA